MLFSRSTSEEPTEYNIFGAMGKELSFKVNSSGVFTKNHYIADYLGSVRVVFDDDGNRIARYDYRGFGEQISSSTGDERSDWLSKEKDRESNLRDDGVRKYSASLGRFTSIDPLWESYKIFSLVKRLFSQIY